MFYLVELVLRDFAIYRGFHQFHFGRGLNLVSGSCGSGKTNLVRALEFALLGEVRNVNLVHLINHPHRAECIEKDENPSCQVSLKMRCSGRDFELSRKLWDYGECVIQEVRFHTSLKESMTTEFIDSIVIEERNIEPVDGFSYGESTPLLILEAVERNIKDDIGMMILDGIFGRLTNRMARHLLRRIVSQNLEQAIILEPSTLDKTMCKELGAYLVEITFN